MKVHQLATRIVYMVAPTDSIDAAIALMEEHGFHHLPVVSDGHVVGMVSDRDVLLSVGWRLSSERRLGSRRKAAIAGPTRIDQIMSMPVISIASSDSVGRAAHLMVEHKIGALPVIDHERLAGLISETDLLRALDEGRLDRNSQPQLVDDCVSEHMRMHVVTAKARDPLWDVVRIFRENHIRHMPVVAASLPGEDILIGIISDRDVRRALGDAAIHDDQAQETGKFYVGPTIVQDAMTMGAVTIESHERVGEVIRLMLQQRIHALPVLSEQTLVGIITETDIVRAVASRAFA